MCDILYGIDKHSSGRVKVVLALLVAERMLPLLKNNEDRYGLCQDVLGECWLWVECGSVGGRELYEENVEKLIVESSYKMSDLEIGAFEVIVNAVFYTSWIAIGEDVRAGKAKSATTRRRKRACTRSDADDMRVSKDGSSAKIRSGWRVAMRIYSGMAGTILKITMMQLD